MAQAPCLRQAHAHNDYLHPRPLFDALEQGFTSVEADVFSVGDRLLVAHTSLELPFAKTFQELYLEPLEKLSKERGGKIMSDGRPLWLLVDIKNNPEKTWSLVAREITNRPSLFCRWVNGKRVNGPVSVVVSGSSPRKSILEAEPRLAGVDGRLPDLGKGLDARGGALDFRCLEFPIQMAGQRSGARDRSGKNASAGETNTGGRQATPVLGWP